MEGKYLITTDEWFTAPDGCQYKAVWGEVEILEDAFLGLKTNRNSSNWFAKICSDESHMIVAGCQIHYVIKCEEAPSTNSVSDWTVSSGSKVNYIRPTQIFIPQHYE